MSLRECVLCDTPLDDGSKTSVVKEKQLASYAEASRKRNDGKVVIFKRSTSLEDHEKCRKHYVTQNSIDAYVKRAKQEADKPKLRSSNGPNFIFKTYCFLCAEQILPDYAAKQRKTRPNKRDPVHLVTKIDVKDKVLRLLENRNDGLAHSIRQRLLAVNDLVAADAQYHLSCFKNLYHPPVKSGTMGRPRELVDIAMQPIYTFLENSDEECQFSMDELIGKMECDPKPHPKTVRAHLLAKYGNDVIVSVNTPFVVCFKNTGYKIITDSWYQQKSSTEREERLRIVQTAAAIIVEDIRGQIYDNYQYPLPDKFLEGVADLIPETLKVFTDVVALDKKRGDMEKWKNKSVAIAHSLIMMIDVLSSLGFSSSYSEATRLEISSIMRPSIELNNNALIQMVYDNADFNVQTIDGRNTFHTMGGIMCVTPKSAVVPDPTLARLQLRLTADKVASVGAVELKPYERTNNVGLSGIKIKDISELFPQSTIVLPLLSHVVWLYCKHMGFQGVGGWNGFMEEVTRYMPYETTRIISQPFINAPPTNLDTIYTALLSGAEKTKSLGQNTTFITFDQPLYLKAREIIASRVGDPELSNVIVRLGGFHLLMSFMGVVGYIMNGSGLTELFNTIYAVNSTDKIMTGHAYARAVRAHILAHTVLSKLIIESINFSPSMQTDIEEIIYGGDLSDLLTVSERECIIELQLKFEAEVQRLAQLGPTAKLWLQYLEMATLMMKFIQSERMGNWHLHLETISNMIPYFHASGHYLYAKCAHLYLQDMMDLENIMPPEEFASFTTHGGFTIRRTEKLWSGTWTDMSIEQFLMRQMKTDGGLTRHRGVSDAILSRWTQGMAAQQEICDAFEIFCGITFATSEQHVDSRDSRVNRDNQDMKIMLEWLRQHPPSSETPDLMCISNGMVGNENINCHLSREMGITGIRAIVGSDFGTVKFKRADRVLPLASVNSALIIHNQLVAINPSTLFQRITIAKKSDEELEEYLSYELCPYPLALFDDCGMRKGVKSTFYKAFKTMPDTQTLPSNTLYVIDGGFLLHRVVWTSGHSFEQICNRYIEYVRSKYKSTAVIVFDGYGENHESTKYMERVRRSTKKHSVEIIFNDSMVPTVSQDNFLANSKNKSRLISTLIKKFEQVNIVTKQAVEDADTLIVTTAYSLARHHESVAVVGEDVDLLVIMIGISIPANVYFIKPGKGKIPPTFFHPPTAIDKHVAEHLLFLHAVSGCDSTSALYNQGKLKCLKVLTKNPDLKLLVMKFKDPNADEEALFEAGEKFMVTLYGGNHHDTTLNKLRYKQYLMSSYKVTSNLASIPPTAAAARNHFLRVFYQIQLWLGNNQLDPKQWGWKSSRNGLIPVTTLLPPAPDNVLRKVACHCKKNCMGKCGCRRAGLFCTNICAECEGKCTNTDSIDFEELDEDTDFRKIAPVQPVQYSTRTVTTEGYEDPQPGPSNVLELSQSGPSQAGLFKERRVSKTDDSELKAKLRPGYSMVLEQSQVGASRAGHSKKRRVESKTDDLQPKATKK